MMLFMALLIALIIGVLLLILTTSVINVGVTIEYPGSPGTMVDPSALAGKPIQAVLLTVSATNAAGWAKVATVDTKTAQKLGNVALIPGKNYALAWCFAFSATGVAIRFKHSSWSPCMPGGHMGSLLHQRRNLLDFAKYGKIPVFNSSNPLDVYVWTAANETPGMICLGLVEMD